MSYHIMIVEDEYWTAMDLAVEVQERGAEVAGPFGSVPQAIELLRSVQRPDAAILDIRLREIDVFPVADILMQDGIPFVFATACMEQELPGRFAEVPRFEKPFQVRACVDSALALAAHSCDRDAFRFPKRPGVDNGRDPASTTVMGGTKIT